jgi:formiminotetrahydrofolate cyclodeaminase
MAAAFSPECEETARRAAELRARALELAELAADIARTGNRNLASDAIAGALLAEAVAQAAGRLVAINLTEGSSVHELAELARRAHAAWEAALS